MLSIHRNQLLLAVVSLSWLAPGVAYAIPSLTPHQHIGVGWEDPAGGGAGVNHHHWNPIFPLYPGANQPNDETPGSPIADAGDNFVNISFDAYSAWDQSGNQALYRNGDAVTNFGHGYIEQFVPYLIEGGAGGLPAAAVLDFNAAITKWETDVYAAFNIDANYGAPSGRKLGLNFEPGPAEDVDFSGALNGLEDVNGNLALDGFTVTWSPGAIGPLARWIPGRQELEFNSTITWFYGGTGNIPVGETDFFTIAMHEIGHMIGLNHINSGVADRLMRADIVVQAQADGTTGVRAPDIGSIFGAEALYTIPEPSCISLGTMGLLALLSVRRRRRA